ncbi:MAG: hypothetical protein IH845_02720 [Nanoarchaeota archaeon]|nr:hypothetical protein [Nanoarchaeota archaeon]
MRRSSRKTKIERFYRFGHDARIKCMLDETKPKGHEIYRSLPPIHYQIGERKPSEMVEDIGVGLIEQGYKSSEAAEYRDDRYYISKDDQYGGIGNPINIVNVAYRHHAEYTLVSPDGLNTSIIIPEQQVVTAELSVYGLGADDAPTFVMTPLGRTPLYDETRALLFEFTKKFPLVEDDAYRSFVGQYENPDSWLIFRNP